MWPRVLTVPFLRSGGEEVLLDVGGQDATEAFEDVGHSDEARETLEKYYVGNVKRKVSAPLPLFVTWPSPPLASLLTNTPHHLQAGDPTPKATASAVSPPADTSGAGLGTALYAFVFVGAAAAYFGYQYLQGQQSQA